MVGHGGGLILGIQILRAGGGHRHGPLPSLIGGVGDVGVLDQVPVHLAAGKRAQGSLCPVDGGRHILFADGTLALHLNGKGGNELAHLGTLVHHDLHARGADDDRTGFRLPRDGEGGPHGAGGYDNALGGGNAVQLYTAGRHNDGLFLLTGDGGILLRDESAHHIVQHGHGFRPGEVPAGGKAVAAHSAHHAPLGQGGYTALRPGGDRVRVAEREGRVCRLGNAKRLAQHDGGPLPADLLTGAGPGLLGIARQAVEHGAPVARCVAEPFGGLLRRKGGPDQRGGQDGQAQNK